MSELEGSLEKTWFSAPWFNAVETEAHDKGSDLTEVTLSARLFIGREEIKVKVLQWP